MTTAAAPVSKQLEDNTIQNRALTPQERRIIRAGLNLYANRMEQRAKQLAEDECPNALQIGLVGQIRGNDHNSGLIGVFTEQMSIEDQAQLTLDDARRALEADTSACVNALFDMPDFPAAVHFTADLQRFVRTWSDEQRSEAIDYALAAAELHEGEVMDRPLPERVRQAKARAVEWSMTDEEREHWLQRGPYEVAWENDLAEGVFLYFAQRTEGEAKVADPDRFDTEKGAQCCAARLNQHWYLTSQGESSEADATPSDSEAAGPESSEHEVAREDDLTEDNED